MKSTTICELEKGIILPDVHAPFHNKRSIKLVSKVVRKWKPKRATVLGDFFDNAACSQHRRPANAEPDFDKEIADGLKVFDYIFGGCDSLEEKDFIMGNHEWRLDRYLLDFARPLYNRVMGEGKDPFGLVSRGWNVIPYMDDTETGPMSLTHDLGKAGLNAVEDAAQTYIGRNCVIGHVHTFKWIVRGNAKGVPFFGCSLGWLGDLATIDYRHRIKAKREYVQAFGIYRYNPKTRIVYLTPVPIVNGTACVEGELYTA